MELTKGQQAALDRLLVFVDAPAEISFSLQGGAGVGKTFLVALFVKALLAQKRRVVVAAPTHKACRVLRGKLDDAGIPWVFKPQQGFCPPGAVIVDTTAALLGVRPLIDDEQDEKELKFKNTGSGSIGTALQGNRPVLVIDEVSMVGREDFEQLQVYLAQHDAKVVAVGDEGQLPPVKKVAIDFKADFNRSALLDEVVRQAKGSDIVKLAWIVRGAEADNIRENLDGISLAIDTASSDIEHVQKVETAFLDRLQAPVEDEKERAVYIAYRNVVVNTVQDAACRKLYGHGRRTFKAGQLVIAATAGYREELYYRGRDGVVRKSFWPKLEQVVANADQLRVQAFDESRKDDTYGVPVTLERVDLPANAKNRVFETFYLSEEELGNKAHPFNVKKAALLATAKELQARFKKGERGIDDLRKAAWSEYFKHDQRIISFSHPFAITSHKSQGSTYREAYVNVADLLAHNKRALYVAVTRPAKKLVV